ncbi:hypothetical protein MA16_Dca003924 [Dendrobium catenatum]|uniref:Uncharacterized protein n=1 Tax=Dendrobium catenatum TaxID=906689 RepID=A0A2I0X1Y5_9ASPA|nr:hypothetical protein MA16_Dca003924 [Dendrobium catenatum]
MQSRITNGPFPLAQAFSRRLDVHRGGLRLGLAIGVGDPREGGAAWRCANGGFRLPGIGGCDWGCSRQRGKERWM